MASSAGGPSSQAPPPVKATGQRSKPRKAAAKASATAPSRKGKERAVNQDDNASDDDRPRRRKHTKAKVTVESSDSSDSDVVAHFSPAASRSSGHSSTSGSVALSDDYGEPDVDDLWDPRNLPPNGHPRRKSQMDQLEHGVYRSALHDVVGAKMDLGRVLLEWEGLRKWREVVDRQANGAKDEDGLRERLERNLDVKGNRKAREEDTPLVSEEGNEEDEVSLPYGTYTPDYTETPPIDFASPYPSQTNSPNPSRELSPIPYPSAVQLSQVARWPLPPNLSFMTNASPLEEELRGLASARRRRRSSAERPTRTKPRSAYARQAPLAKPARPKARSSGSSSSSSDPTLSDLDDASSSLDDSDSFFSLSSSPEPPNSIITTLDSIIFQMTAVVPRSPFPARSYWSQRSREDAGRREKGVGWEEVVRCAGEVGLPKSITDKLRARMESVYGPMKVDPNPKPRPLALRTQSLFDTTPPEKKKSTSRTPRVPKNASNAGEKPATVKNEKKLKVVKTPRASAKKSPIARARKQSESSTPTPEREEQEERAEPDEQAQSPEPEDKFASAQFIVDSSDEEEVGDGWRTAIAPGAVGKKRKARSQRGPSKRRRKLGGGGASVGEVLINGYTAKSAPPPVASTSKYNFDNLPPLPPLPQLGAHASGSGAGSSQHTADRAEDAAQGPAPIPSYLDPALAFL